MGLKMKDGTEVRITDFRVNNESKTASFTVAPKDGTTIAAGANRNTHRLVIEASTSIIGSSLVDAYTFVRTLKNYKAAKNT